jgi:hypothetical protein
MPALTPTDVLQLAFNVLRDSAESRRMPSGIELDAASIDTHADAADVLADWLKAGVDPDDARIGRALKGEIKRQEAKPRPNRQSLHVLRCVQSDARGLAGGASGEDPDTQ